jgi:hypothetical protein
LPHVLNGFFENCILDEERILKWYEIWLGEEEGGGLFAYYSRYNNPNKKADTKLSKEMRERSLPFIDWLKYVSFSLFVIVLLPFLLIVLV